MNSPSEAYTDESEKPALIVLDACQIPIPKEVVPVAQMLRFAYFAHPTNGVKEDVVDSCIDNEHCVEETMQSLHGALARAGWGIRICKDQHTYALCSQTGTQLTGTGMIFPTYKEAKTPDGVVVNRLKDDEQRCLHALALLYTLNPTNRITAPKLGYCMHAKRIGQGDISLEDATEHAKRVISYLNATLRGWRIGSTTAANEVVYRLQSTKDATALAMRANTGNGIVHLTPRTQEIAERIAQTVPPIVIHTMNTDADKEGYRREVAVLAAYMAKVTNGEIQPVRAFDVIGKPKDIKIAHTIAFIRQQVSGIVCAEDKKKSSIQSKLHKDMLKWRDMLGSDAEEVFKQVCAQLPDIERVLFYTAASMDFLDSVGLNDVAVCAESRFASHIRRATSASEWGRQSEIEAVLETLLERGREGTINVEEVLAALSETKGYANTMKKLIKAAQEMGLSDELCEVLQNGDETLAIAIEMQNLDIPYTHEE